MHDAHTLCVFFSDATFAEKTSALLEVCSRDPDLLVNIILDMNGGNWKKAVREIAESGKAVDRPFKIEAIKKCREITGWGLKESKDAVEKLFADENIRF